MAKRVVATIRCDGDDNSGYTASISNEGYVYIIGKDYRNSTAEEFSMRKVPSLKNIQSIDCSDHILCLDSLGSVFTFGGNVYGQLGIGNQNTHFISDPQKVKLPPCKQVSCGDSFTICLISYETFLEISPFTAHWNKEFQLSEPVI